MSVQDGTSTSERNASSTTALGVRESYQPRDPQSPRFDAFSLTDGGQFCFESFVESDRDIGLATARPSVGAPAADKGGNGSMGLAAGVGLAALNIQDAAAQNSEPIVSAA